MTSDVDLRMDDLKAWFDIIPCICDKSCINSLSL